MAMAETADIFRETRALPDPDATARLGTAIAARLGVGDCVALWGDLGAGKTTLARAILHGRGVREDVPSPTFTIVQRYDTPKLIVNHYDLYRLKSSKVLSFGERKMLDNAKQLIVKELAVARKWTEEKVEAELEKACA